MTNEFLKIICLSIFVGSFITGNAKYVPDDESSTTLEPDGNNETVPDDESSTTLEPDVTENDGIDPYIGILDGYNGNVTETDSINLDIGNPDDHEIFQNNEGSYAFYKENVTWEFAQEACTNYGTNLVVIDSFEKYDYIMSKIRIGNKPGPHVGIRRWSHKNKWIIPTTGLSPKSIPWAPKTWVKNPANNCLAMWNDYTGVGADECDRPRPYICESPVSKNVHEDADD